MSTVWLYHCKYLYIAKQTNLMYVETSKEHLICISCVDVVVVFRLFFSPVPAIAWLVMMMVSAVLALTAFLLLGHLLCFHIYLSKYGFLLKCFAGTCHSMAGLSLMLS